MLFNSFSFCIFFIIVLVFYYLLPSRHRWWFVLLVSYYFYACWRIDFLGLLLLTTVWDYLAGLLIGGTENRRLRTLYLIMSVGMNMALLFTFKYLDFALNSAEALIGYFGIAADLPTYKLVLPVGISFYTFQSVSYTIDVYRRAIQPERHLGIYAAFVTFFPQLVAGPIERAGNILPQFRQEKRFTYERFKSGLQLALWGMFKKVVVADTVATIVNAVFTEPTRFSGPTGAFAGFLFAVQVYGDFSGYSDIAIGTARILGFDFNANFRQPFYSKSMAEFWTRWHISLSSWFHQYVYVPLGGNRVSKGRWYFNTIFTTFLSGIWHGAAWNPVMWGVLNGVLIVGGRETKALRTRFTDAIGLTKFPTVHTALQTLITFFLFVFTLIAFRSRSLGDTWYIWTNALNFSNFSLTEITARVMPQFELLLACFLVFSLFAADFVLSHPRYWPVWHYRPVRWAGYAFCFYGIALFGVFKEISFIYFQF